MASNTAPETTETVETVEKPKAGRPATQVTAALESADKVAAFNLTRRALGVESVGDGVRQAIDEYIDNHADERQKAVEFFGW